MKLFYLKNLIIKKGFYFILALTFSLAGSSIYYYFQAKQVKEEQIALSSRLTSLTSDFEKIKNEDQVKRNEILSDEIKNIQSTYQKSSNIYEKLLDYQGKDIKVKTLYANAIFDLSKKNYASASAKLVEIEKILSSEQIKIAAEFKIPANVPENNTAPSSGYAKQSVKTDIGTFLVDIISADLGSTRVIVDSASDSDCSNDCPVLSLSDYVSRNGAFAGVNGSYFCPADYPSCADKKNSYDTLIMNKNKKYINSDNNVYSKVPAVIFLEGSVRFVGQSLEWGRDTSVNGVLANYPLLLSGGNIAFGGGSDPKQGSKGSRSFVGTKGSTIYIGVVHNATVAEVAHVLKALGIDYALNLDSGGSTALWSGSYKVGPGRNIPSAILFVHK
ncbi:phosphodiester glycosidase family protein [Candidatus Daviesbacteria bacterium]|nr:phosphodiester glycosidase family protein [Candidatus Daviesbacteria bacterium]